MSEVFRGKRGLNPRLPVESHPSKFAPSGFFDRDAARRRMYAANVAAEDIEADFGNCTQCNAPQWLSEAETCYNCGSDNRLGRSFYR